MTAFTPVPQPLDFTDAQAFPELAEAIAHYRANRARIDAEMENDK